MKYEFQNSLGMLTGSISKNIGRRFEQNAKLKGYETHSLEWTVLSFLANHDYYTQNELGEIIGRNKVFVKRLIDDLESKKFVKREIMGKDKRHNKIIITAKGMKRYNSLLPIVESTLDEAFDGFDEIEVNILIRLLKNVANNIK